MVGSIILFYPFSNWSDPDDNVVQFLKRYFGDGMSLIKNELGRELINTNLKVFLSIISSSSSNGGITDLMEELIP